jgi:hypothetical protein
MNTSSIRAQLSRIRADHAQAPGVLEAAAAVQEALTSSARLGVFTSPEDCSDWTRADTGAWGRARFDQSCQGWATDVRSRLVFLSSQLRVADDWPRAEVIASLADETLTAQEQAQEVTPDAVDWWSQTPPALRWTLAGLAALLLAKGLSDG